MTNIVSFSRVARDGKGKFISMEKAGQLVKAEVSKQLAKRPVVNAATIDAGLGLDKAAKSAQESMGVFLKADIEKTLAEKSVVNAATIDASLGLDKAAKSAQESMGVFIKNDIEKTLSRPTIINSSTIDASLGIDKPVKSAAESFEAFVQGGKIKPESTSVLTKVKNFFKGKGGKYALAGLAALALIGGGIYLYNRYKKNKAQQADPVKPEPTPTPTPTPVTPEAKVHKVEKGDNVWNIAKKDLIDSKNDANYTPSNKEILDRTHELMELNGLKYEADNYHVLIKPGDEIKLN